MGTLDIIFGSVLLLISVVTIIVCLMQGKSQQDMTALTGGTTDSHFSKNEGRTKDAILSKLTAVLLVLLFAGTLASTIIQAYK